jgi:AcrR family transcriptional regulator
VRRVPKIVDHEERRQRIADALRRIAAEDGLEAVSLGQVALAAGISKGQVQHYFPTKDAMLRYATRTLRDQVERRMTEQLAGNAPTLRSVLLALLPLDAESRAEALVTNAFLWRALKDDDLAAQFRTGYTGLHEALKALIEAAQDAGELRTDLVPAHEADLLVAMVGGLGDTVLLGHRTAEEAIALLDHHLDRLTS